MRTAIYARYSSDLQREASIEDQVRLCRERVVQMGGEVAGVYTDAAISGSRLQNRPGIRSLLDDARAHSRPFDTVIAEALDRLSRDQEDIAGLFKRLVYLDIRIHTLTEGEINELHIGLKGTMNALVLKDLAAKVRRGQRGRAEARRAAGGLSYGYRVVRKIGPDGEIERGQREVDPVQAAVIRRIFEEYFAVRSPRAIAADLNREGVPSRRLLASGSYDRLPRDRAVARRPMSPPRHIRVRGSPRAAWRRQRALRGPVALLRRRARWPHGRTRHRAHR